MKSPQNPKFEFWQFMAGIQKVDPRLHSCISNWLVSCNSVKTTQERQSKLISFFRFVRHKTHQHPCFAVMSVELLNSYFALKKTKGKAGGKPYSSAYLQNLHSTLKSLFDAATKEGHIQFNPMDKVFKPRGEEKVGYDILSDDETARMIEYFRKKAEESTGSRPSIRRSWRMKYTMVWCYLSMGIRSSELLLTTIRDFIDNDGDAPKLRVRMKGARIELKAIPDSTASLIRQWINKYRRKASLEDYIFVTLGKKSRPIDSAEVLSWIKSACKKIGIKKRITTHSLRATMLTRLFRQGANIYEVQAVAGHKKTETTFIYIKLAEYSSRSAMRRYDLADFLNGRTTTKNEKPAATVYSGP